jgi:hypothetical protein
MAKINRKGFYLACDHEYFESLAKTFVLSAQQHATWAHVHLHVFDGTSDDIAWAQQHGCSITTESTPAKLQTPEARRGYWVNMRFVRLPELYEDSTPVISIDADSVFARPLAEQQFDLEMQQSWVTTAKKRAQRSLGSAVGFAADSARHCLQKALLNLSTLDWYQDQIEMDLLLDQGIFRAMDQRYSDFKMTNTSYIWTGKGDRKFKRSFQLLSARYHG